MGHNGAAGKGVSEGSNADGVPQVDFGIDALIESTRIFRTWVKVSGIGILLLFIRIIKYMRNSISRVELLEYTLRLAVPTICVYLFYMVFVFVGFANLASISFASLAEDFYTFPNTVLTLFMMWFGQFDKMNEIMARTDDPLVSTFFITFMLFFYFINVQMFNAIINQSYNRACVDMEPGFERERETLKRKALEAKQ